MHFTAAKRFIGLRDWRAIQSINVKIINEPGNKDQLKGELIDQPTSRSHSINLLINRLINW